MGPEANWHDEREFAVGNISWRWRKGRGSLDQVERFGIENSRPGTLDDPAAHNSSMPIHTKGETDHTLSPARRRWVALHFCKARHQRLLPTRSRRRNRSRGEGPVATGGTSSGCGLASCCAEASRPKSTPNAKPHKAHTAARQRRLDIDRTCRAASEGSVSRPPTDPVLVSVLSVTMVDPPYELTFPISLDLRTRSVHAAAWFNGLGSGQADLHRLFVICAGTIKFAPGLESFAATVVSCRVPWI